MPAMDKINATLMWKLRKGSHEFPGEHGGTCINEAAVVAAGFPYRSVGSAKDVPECFSPVYSQFLIVLNDAMPAYLRQEMLLPFVTRLAGTRDTWDVELQRLDYMVNRTAEDLSAWTRKHPRICVEVAPKLLGARAAINIIGVHLSRRQNFEAWAVMENTTERLVVVYQAFARHLKRPQGFYLIACNMLRDAMKIGKQGEQVPPELVVDRMDQVRKGPMVRDDVAASHKIPQTAT